MIRAPSTRESSRAPPGVSRSDRRDGDSVVYVRVVLTGVARRGSIGKIEPKEPTSPPVRRLYRKIPTRESHRHRGHGTRSGIEVRSLVSLLVSLSVFPFLWKDDPHKGGGPPSVSTT